MDDPSTGPIPRDKFQELVAAPFGEATKKIREYDPEWGRAEGEKFDWTVKVRRASRTAGVAVIKAANQKEADKLCDDLTDDDIDWDDDWQNDFEILSVEPTKQKSRR